MGLPVVLVHGLRTSRTMWRAQVEALERAGRTAHAVDLPGHGARVGEPFTFDGAVATVRQAADVVGLSLGGYVAIAHAARHPEQVAGLVAASCSTRPLRPLVEGWSLAVRGIVRLPDHGERLNAFMVRRFLPAPGAVDVGAGGFALLVTEDVLRQVATAAPHDDLATIEAPVWLVNGRYDHFRGDERAFLRACRHGRLVVVPGATHLVSLVAPERFTRVVLEALDEVDGTDASRAAAAAVSRDAGVRRAAS